MSRSDRSQEEREDQGSNGGGAEMQSDLRCILCAEGAEDGAIMGDAACHPDTCFRCSMAKAPTLGIRRSEVDRDCLIISMDDSENVKMKGYEYKIRIREYEKRMLFWAGHMHGGCMSSMSGLAQQLTHCDSALRCRAMVVFNRTVPGERSPYPRVLAALVQDESSGFRQVLRAACEDASYSMQCAMRQIALSMFARCSVEERTPYPGACRIHAAGFSLNTFVHSTSIHKHASKWVRVNVRVRTCG